MAITFSDVTSRCLKQAGWYFGRAVPFDPIREALARAGFEVFGPVEAFLTEFHGLQIEYPRPDGKSTGIINLDILKVLSTEDIFQMVDQYYRPVVGAPVCVIGEIDRDMLLMDSHGRVYSIVWPHVSRIGDTGDDFLERSIASGRQNGIPIDPKSSASGSLNPSL